MSNITLEELLRDNKKYGGDRHDIRGALPITAEWNIYEEAWIFARRVLLGMSTREKASDDILMTDAQLEDIESVTPSLGGLLQRIQKRRARTHEEFLRQLDNPPRHPEAPTWTKANR